MSGHGIVLIVINLTETDINVFSLGIDIYTTHYDAYRQRQLLNLEPIFNRYLNI